MYTIDKLSDFRALGQDMHCLEALRYQTLYLLCREGNYSEVIVICASAVNERLDKEMCETCVIFLTQWGSNIVIEYELCVISFVWTF